MRSYNPVHVGHAGQIKRAVKLLQSAKRPMIYTGGGVILGNAAVTHRAGGRLNYPVTNTLMGLGGFPATDRSSSACWACTAPTRPTWPCITAMCCLPSVHGSMTA